MLSGPFDNPVFIERAEFLNNSQFWPLKLHRKYQLFALQRLVRHVYARVPVYREVMDKYGFGPSDIRSLKDLERFPFVDKKTIQLNPDAFLDQIADRSALAHRTTGGSTGAPLTIWYDDDFPARDKANTDYYMRVFGLDIFNWKSVRLYGDHIPSKLLNKGQYWRLEHGRKLVMSCYHIHAETAPLYVEKINTFRPRYIHTRPSAILPLAKYVIENSLKVLPIRTIICDGEYLTTGQRLLIERAFQGRLVNIYGHTEGCCVGHPCAHSDALHFMPQIGIMELLNEKGAQVTRQGERGELVVTGFNNPVMPLIRYRTGDIGYLGESTCQCGRAYQKLEGIEGRVQDFVIDSIGNLTPLAPAVFNYNDLDWHGVHEFKVIQNRPGELMIQIQLERAMIEDGTKIKARLERGLGAILAGFRIKIELVQEIPKSSIGKHRYLDQRLDIYNKVSF